MSDANEKSLQKASEKAATEVATAAAVISDGCDPSEAIETKIKEGPSQVVGEFVELNEKHKYDSSFNPDIVALRIDEKSPLMKFRVSSCGRFLLPLAQELIPVKSMSRAPQDLKSSDPEERKRRDDMAKHGKDILKLMNPAKEIQTSLKYPISTAPGIAKSLSIGSATAAALYTLSVIAFMILRYKGKKL